MILLSVHKSVDYPVNKFSIYLTKKYINVMFIVGEE